MKDSVYIEEKEKGQDSTLNFKKPVVIVLAILVIIILLLNLISAFISY